MPTPGHTPVASPSPSPEAVAVSTTPASAAESPSVAVENEQARGGAVTLFGFSPATRITARHKGHIHTVKIIKDTFEDSEDVLDRVCGIIPHADEATIRLLELIKFNELLSQLKEELQSKLRAAQDVLPEAGSTAADSVDYDPEDQSSVEDGVERFIIEMIAAGFNGNGDQEETSDVEKIGFCKPS
ncbi:MAG: hypothetical protein A3F46_08495 [Legionellales bacterium RIFCSPHIGHO2_12_FULL_42_9]|nr:MAG: hypothetical protein A3F46_08495 [Legionellales bacterium RIFCSPHIGHO2_12_FULL_42_9]